MENLTRRQLIQAGAAGTVVAGIATVAGAAPAGAEAGKLRGVHIHGSLAGGPPVVHGRIVDITVYGTDDNLSGSGWDVDPEAEGSMKPRWPDKTVCVYTQHGSLNGDTVRLEGRNMFFHQPGDEGAIVTTEANLATGQIKWTIKELAGSEGGAIVFEGTGVVGRI
jgi:hypothetical protein